MAFVKQFTPNWFTIGMGTGITALGSFLLPGGPLWLKEWGTALWLFNTGLVAILFALMIWRWLVDWPNALKVLDHPVQSMFLGAVPMALTTVVNGFIDMGPHVFGPVAIRIGYDLWLINVAIALVSGILVPFLMFISHDHRLERMTGVWLMPVVPAEVVAATGGLLIPHMTSAAAQQTLMVVSMGLWALSVPLAFLMLGMLFLRLALHNLPPAEMAISTWISLGTLGTGVMGLVTIGHSLPVLFGAIGLGMQGAALLASLVLWGFGLWWLTMSILITVYYARHGLPFNLGWWGLTFPLGVFGGGTDLLYGQFHIALFGDFAVLFFLMLTGFWAMVATRTLHGLVAGTLIERTPKPTTAPWQELPVK